MNTHTSKRSQGPNRVVEIVSRIYPVWSIRNEECELMYLDYADWRIEHQSMEVVALKKIA